MIRLTYVDPLFLEFYRSRWARIITPYKMTYTPEPLYIVGSYAPIELMSGSSHVEGEIQVGRQIYEAAQKWDGYAGLSLSDFLDKMFL